MSSAFSSPDTSFLLWLLAAGVTTLAAHVGLDWLRIAQDRSGWRPQGRAALLAALVLGCTLCAAAVLTLAADALPFQVGYRLLHALLLLPLAVLGCVPACLALARSRRWWWVVGAGLWFGLLAAGMQMAWVNAVGLRPGIVWRPEFVAAGAGLMAAGCAAALWLAFAEVGRDSERRILWHGSAAVVLGLSLLAGQEVLTLGIGLGLQVGSVYAREMPAVVLTLLTGVVLPLLLVAMCIDLWMRRADERRSRSRSMHSANFNPQKRRRRRHRVRSL